MRRLRSWLNLGRYVQCPACGGKGYELDGRTPCRMCDGRKVVPK